MSMVMIIPIGFYGFRIEKLEDFEKIRVNGKSIGVGLFRDAIPALYFGKPVYDAKELKKSLDKRDTYSLDLANKLKEIGINVKRHNYKVFVSNRVVKVLDSIV